MRCDYHIHSSISADSSTRPELQVKQAEALGWRKSVLRNIWRSIFTAGMPGM
jgi:histidinol phosphatase-like PHP family hydrolase